jgi:hypothetical protein
MWMLGWRAFAYRDVGSQENYRLSLINVSMQGRFSPPEASAQADN